MVSLLDNLLKILDGKKKEKNFHPSGCEEEIFSFRQKLGFIFSQFLSLVCIVSVATNFIEPRLFISDCDDSFRLKCALTAYKERPHSATNCADTKSIIGSVLWLFSNGNASRSGKSGEVTVVNYLDGKCSVLKVGELFVYIVKSSRYSESVH